MKKMVFNTCIKYDFVAFKIFQDYFNEFMYFFLKQLKIK